MSAPSGAITPTQIERLLDSITEVNDKLNERIEQENATRELKEIVGPLSSKWLSRALKPGMARNLYGSPVTLVAEYYQIPTTSAYMLLRANKFDIDKLFLNMTDVGKQAYARFLKNFEKVKQKYFRSMPNNEVTYQMSINPLLEASLTSQTPFNATTDLKSNQQQVAPPASSFSAYRMQEEAKRQQAASQPLQPSVQDLILQQAVRPRKPASLASPQSPSSPLTSPESPFVTPLFVSKVEQQRETVSREPSAADETSDEAAYREQKQKIFSSTGPTFVQPRGLGPLQVYKEVKSDLIVEQSQVETSEEDAYRREKEKLFAPSSGSEQRGFLSLPSAGQQYVPPRSTPVISASPGFTYTPLQAYRPGTSLTSPSTDSIAGLARYVGNVSRGDLDTRDVDELSLPESLVGGRRSRRRTKSKWGY